MIDQTPLKDLIQNSSLISVGLGVSLKSVKSWNSDNVCSELTLVGIAGKIYLGFAINADIHFRNVSGFYHIPNPVYCWSEEELNNFAERNKIQIAPRNVFKLGDFFKYNGTEFASIRDHMIEHRISIFTLSETCSGYSLKEKFQSIYCVINGDNLKYAQFQKCLDSYTIYQELAMWNSGVLSGQETPMVTINEKIKVKQHGFDKWSFRKMGEHSK